MSWIGWWHEADWIVRGVFLLLGLLSLLSWSVMFSRWLRFRKIMRREQAVIRTIQQRMELPENTPSAQLLSSRDRYRALSAEGRHALRSQTLRDIRLELESGLTTLATIGNAAPFIGLFGTVWGIMNALHGLSGEALNMEMVTGPVAEALVATAAGLFAAVPAVAGYNFLVRRLRRLMGVIDHNALLLTEPELQRS
uniref:MotA/TolQ/ExbB proton channel n=1 Tax=Magnetococcus massalia (strain MO-1) TaxID=451514 RepID=A0A1S7LC48_MAGMO|nr:MotA/TolQ/ExbB proton channel [Candidatus Magnetococcus massalia]